MGVLGIVAGGGPLPRLVAHAATARGRPVFILGFAGVTADETRAGRMVPLGAVGEAMAALRAERVDEVVLAGPVPRPRLGDLRMDARAARLLGRVMFGRLGDDAGLRAVIAESEHEGMRVIGAHEAAPELLAPLGRVGEVEADEADLRDLEAGIEGCRQLGDAGQAVIVRDGRIVDREGPDGTDALLAGLGRGHGGVMVKLPKPGQDRRVDLPTIGPRTVELAAAAGLRGLFVEADGTLLIDRAGISDTADRNGLFVVGVGRP